MRFMLKGKIHRARVTGADLEYEGSVGIDPVILEAADMVPYEQVHIFNIDNGERLMTYIIEGERGSGEIVLNGAAARKAAVGDKIILVTFDMVEEADIPLYKPRIVVLDANNAIVRMQK